MAPLYRKTEKGLTEIETRTHRLAPRLRSALIMIDGRRTEEELHKLILGQPAETVAVLLEQGYIELVASVPSRSSPRSSGGTPTSPGIPSEVPGQTGSSVGTFDHHRRQAVRFLNEQLGPGAEALAIKIEKARDWKELKTHFEVAVQVLRSGRGAAAARDFTERYVDSLP